MAASVTALNEIGAINQHYQATNKKFNSNENLLDDYENGIVSGSPNGLLLQKQPNSQPAQQSDLEIMLVEKAKSDSYMKYLDLQQQHLLLTPKQTKGGVDSSKLVKYNRSSANSSPLTSTTTTNSSSCIVSPTNSTSKIQEINYKRAISPSTCQSKKSNLIRQQNENDYYMQSSKLKPISILVQQLQQQQQLQIPQSNSTNTLKSASPSPSPKANEIWLEYGCI